MSAAGDAPEAEPVDVPTRVGGSQGDWRVERARLQQRRTEDVLKRKPRFGSFAQTSAHVQALGLSSKEEWLAFLELGERRSPYIPSDPEAYYQPRGTWLGWRIWLTGEL